MESAIIKVNKSEILDAPIIWINNIGGLKVIASFFGLKVLLKYRKNLSA